MEEISVNSKTPILCPHFGVCGGCRFQDVDYKEQLKAKEHFVQNLFGHAVSIEPIIASKKIWHYRNKMEFSFSESKDGKKFLGLMLKGRRGKVLTLETCFLSNFWFTRLLKQVFEWWLLSDLKAFRPLARSGVLRTLTLREGMRTAQKMAVLTVENDLEEKHFQSFVQLMRPHVDTLILRKQFTEKKMPTRFVEKILFGTGYIHEILEDALGKKWKFKIGPTSFFQPNTEQAEILYQKAASFVEGETLFDLYCGTGTLGIFCSNQTKKVIGIEINEEAVLNAKDNIQTNGVTHMEVLQGDVKDVLEKVSVKPDTVIVDPPRAGLDDKTLQLLLKLKPQKILYISCNPKTQYENCQKLLNYRIVALQPIDQFPHTEHLENIAYLTSL